MRADLCQNETNAVTTLSQNDLNFEKKKKKDVTRPRFSIRIAIAKSIGR